MGRRRSRIQLLCLLAATPASAWLSPPSRRPHTRLQAVVPKVDLENVEEAFAYAAEIREHAPSLFERLETAKPEDALEMLTYAEQLQKATTYLRPSARQAVRYALEVAFLAHRGQTRRSGQPFVTHPVAVASILAETRMDRDAVVSGLLHDTVEDTDMTFQEVEAMFGRDVRGIVEGETKVSKLPKMARELNTPDWDAEREQVENMRSMCVAVRKSNQCVGCTPSSKRRVDGVESPRHRADSVTATTSRRWRRISTPSSGRRRGNGVHAGSWPWPATGGLWS
jgi:hypothetical protein